MKVGIGISLSICIFYKFNLNPFNIKTLMIQNWNPIHYIKVPFVSLLIEITNALDFDIAFHLNILFPFQLKFIKLKDQWIGILFVLHIRDYNIFPNIITSLDWMQLVPLLFPIASCKFGWHIFSIKFFLVLNYSLFESHQYFTLCFINSVFFFF